MDRAHDVEGVSFLGTTLVLRVDGREYHIDVADVSERLARATPAERARFEVSPSGYGIHWPDLDEDLSIDGLIGVTHACPLAGAKA
ncbi:MAG: DUF2442 domain-containing protein [Planctomycetes bacterium]|nr:DUF2442 domain-containing protein [Planctomycetota bacterium]